MTMLGDQSAEQVIKHLAELAEGDVLSRVVVSAQIDADGRLSKVGGIDAKLAALFGESPFVVRARTGQFPPRAVGIAQDQAKLLADSEIEAHRKAHALPRLCFQETFAGLVADLRVQQSARPGVAPFRFADELGQENYDVALFEGREWLFERIEDLVASHDRGLIVLKAGAGFGKTAFALKLIETYGGQLLGGAWVLAWHVFRRNQSAWLPTPALAGQIEYQLRDRLLMPLSDGGSELITPQNAPTVLKQVLEAAARKLEAAPERKLLIVVDGLDEAFGANTPIEQRGQMTYLQGLFPQKLPPGVFVLLTSRPGDHLRALGDPADLLVLDSEADAAFDQANRQDLREYLTRRITEYGESHIAYPSEIQLLVERMVEACQGAFFVAEWFARKETLDRPDVTSGLTNFECWCQPNAELPRGIDEMLKKDWDHKANILQDEKWDGYLPVLATALALWHQQGTQPTRKVITDLIESARAAARQRDSTVPLSVGKLDTEDIKTAGIEACLKQLQDWCIESGGKERRYVFSHSRIPELILEVLAKQAGDEAIVQEVHRLLAWSTARWRELKGDSRTAALRGLPQHLLVLAAEHREAANKLADTLLDYEYLVAALGANPRTVVRAIEPRELTDTVSAASCVIADANSDASEQMNLLARALHLSCYALTRNVAELPSQLHGRFWHKAPPRISELLQEAKIKTEWPWMLEKWGNLLSGPDESIVHVISAHEEPITALTITPNGKNVISGSNDCSLRVWDTRSGALIHVLRDHLSPIDLLAVSSDGQLLLSTSRVSPHPMNMSTWFDENGEYVKEPSEALKIDERTIRIWDLRSGTLKYTLSGSEEPVIQLLVTGDSKFAVSAAEWNSIRVWDLRTGKERYALSTSLDDLSELHLETTPSRVLLRQVERSGATRVWDLETGLPVKQSHRSETDRRPRASSSTGSPSSDVLRSDNNARPNIQEWPVFQDIPSASPVCVSEDGRLAVASPGGGKLRIVDLKRDQHVTRPDEWDRPRIVLVNDCDVALVHKSKVQVLDGETGEKIREFRINDEVGFIPDPAITTDGTHLLSATHREGHYQLVLWSTAAGEEVYSRKGPSQVIEITVSPDGRFGLCWDIEENMTVWDLTSASESYAVTGRVPLGQTVKFTADGRYLVYTRVEEGEERQYQLCRLDLIHYLERSIGINGVAYPIAIADLLRKIVATVNSQVIQVDIEYWTVDCVASASGADYYQPVRSICLVPKAAEILVATCDGRIQLWEMGSFTVKSEVATGCVSILTMLVLEEERRGCYLSASGELGVWDLGLGKMLAIDKADVGVGKLAGYMKDDGEVHGDPVIPRLRRHPALGGVIVSRGDSLVVYDLVSTKRQCTFAFDYAVLDINIPALPGPLSVLVETSGARMGMISSCLGLGCWKDDTLANG